MPLRTCESWLGPLTLEEENGAITHLHWKAAEHQEETTLLKEAAAQLEAYLKGRLKDFDLPLAPKGNPFQKAVYDAMLAIPYGETRTYGDLANALDTYGQPVGQACGANPIPIIIPCHRILSATGLGDYSGLGGTQTKIELLKLEGGYPFLI